MATRGEIEKVAVALDGAGTRQVREIVLRLKRDLDYLRGETDASPEAKHRDRIKRRIAEEIVDLNHIVGE